jgi:AbrB family looped-hinge helix DNA binding protein
MTVTIDKAGRVVIPASVRARLGLRPGTPLELSADDSAIHLAPVAPRPELIRRGGRLVARPTLPVEERPVVDVAAVIDEERSRWP